MIKVEHTIFALPFAYTALLLTDRQFAPANHWLWVTAAMLGARTAAMSLNRLIDRHIDAQNPRTAGRALPRKQLSLGEVWLYTALSLALLTLATLQLSPLALQLFPIVLFFLTFYSYTKRFTWLCHFFLGATLAWAPLGAWAASAGTLPPAAFLLALSVAVWVTGFDIIYACDDYDFDRSYGLHSIPARFGLASAFWIARLLHLATLLCFTLVGLWLHLGLPYWAGLAVATLLLFRQHCRIRPHNLSVTGGPFLRSNGLLSLLLFAGVLLDRLFHS